MRYGPVFLLPEPRDTPNPKEKHAMQWKVHGRRTIYDSPWVSLDLVDVEQSDGHRYEQIPSGRVEAGESPEHAAAREAEEETGWRPGPLRLLVASQPSNGSIDTVHYLFHADYAEHVGAPADRSEAERIEWVPLSEIRSLIAKGEIVSGPTLIGLLLVAGSLSSVARRGHAHVPG